MTANVNEKTMGSVKVSILASLLHRPMVTHSRQCAKQAERENEQAYFDGKETSTAACTTTLTTQPAPAAAVRAFRSGPISNLLKVVDGRISQLYYNLFAAIALSGLCFYYSWRNGAVRGLR